MSAKAITAILSVLVLVVSGVYGYNLLQHVGATMTLYILWGLTWFPMFVVVIVNAILNPTKVNIQIR